MDEKNPYNIYYMSNIQVNKISGVRPDNPAGFVQISGKSSIRPDSKNHYPVHPYKKILQNGQKQHRNFWKLLDCLLGVCDTIPPLDSITLATMTCL